MTRRAEIFLLAISFSAVRTGEKRFFYNKIFRKKKVDWKNFQSFCRYLSRWDSGAVRQEMYIVYKFEKFKIFRK